MNCSNCGAQLIGTEQVCPICGNPLTVGMPDNLAPMQPDPMLTEPVVPDMSGTEMLNPVPQKPRKDGKVFAIILAMLAVAIIGVGVVLSLSEAPEAEPVVEDEEEEEVDTSKMVYSGYEFHIPEGYQLTMDSSNAMFLKNDEVIYTINLDYTNSYETYKSAFLAVPKERSNVVVLSATNNREYVMAPLLGPTGEQALQYITKADDGVVFTGYIVRSNYQLEEMDAVPMVLNNFLTVVKKSEEVDADKIDAGVNGIVNYLDSFRKENFVFDAKEEVEE